MYICPNCKKEYESEVTFCSACGTKVEPVCVVPVAQPKEPAVVALFAFLTKLVNIIVAFCSALSIADPYINTSFSKYSSYGYATYHPNEEWATFALIFAFTAIGLAIASLIIACAKKAEQKSKFNAITNLVASTLLFIFSIVLLSFA